MSTYSSDINRISDKFDKLNLTMGAVNKYKNEKEKINFPIKDSRLNKTTGNVFVEKNDVLEDMLDEEALDRTRKMRRGMNRSRQLDSSINDERMNYRSSPSMNEIPQQLLKEQRILEAIQLEEMIKEKIQKTIQKGINRKDMLYSHLTNDIEESMMFLDSIDKNMLLMDETKRNKTRRQFEDWNTQIHGNIQVSHFFCYFSCCIEKKVFLSLPAVLFVNLYFSISL